MAKITIEGESAEIDLKKLGLHESIALQRATGFRPKELAEHLTNEDAIAMAAFVWLVLRRMGKDVTWEQIETGEYYVDQAAIVIEPDESEVAANAATLDPPVAAEVAAKTSSKRS